MRANLHGDRVLLTLTVVLLGVGLLMIYSSSSMIGYNNYGDSLYFFKRQLCWTIVGLAALVFFAGISLDLLRRLSSYFGIAAVLMLVMVLIPGVGQSVHGAQRWISCGAFFLQPAEVAKFLLVIFLASNLSRRAALIRDFKRGVLPYFALIAVVFFLLNRQPDLGTAIIISMIAYFMIFLAGARLSHLALPFLLCLPLFYYFYVMKIGYRWKRIVAFLDPYGDPLEGGFQIIQSFIALGTGGIYGVGLGDSAQKHFHLPEPHTDFIFAIIGEEMGFVGSVILLILFAMVFFRNAGVARSAPNLYGFLLASGLTMIISVQVLVNLAVVTGLLPTKGITLPFLSYGGSSLVINMSAIGLLTNISMLAEESKFSGQEGG